MFSERFRRPRKLNRAGRRRACCSGLEALEGRQLLTYSPIGSLPSLVVSGQAGPIAAYGGPIAVTLDISNQGASSTVEPLNLEPGATSSADAGPGRVGVYLLRTPRARPGGPGSLFIGDVETPSIAQNSVTRVTQTLTMPARGRRFPGSGRTAYIGFRPQAGRFGRNGGTPVPVQINAALPDLAAIALDLPVALHPGDAIAPALKIANYGTVPTGAQGPVTVLLVASTDTQFGPTDVILARYTIGNLPGLSQAPARRIVLGDVNLDNPPNVTTLETTAEGTQVTTLPTGGGYFVGVIVDPLNEIRELSEVGRGPSSELQLVRRVEVEPGLAPAGVLSAASPRNNLFPTPAFAPLGNLNDFLTTPTLGLLSIRSSGARGARARGLGRLKAR